MVGMRGTSETISTSSRESFAKARHMATSSQESRGAVLEARGELDYGVAWWVEGKSLVLARGEIRAARAARASHSCVRIGAAVDAKPEGAPAVIPCPARGVLARTAFHVPCGARGARRSLVDDFRPAPAAAPGGPPPGIEFPLFRPAFLAARLADGASFNRRNFSATGAESRLPALRACVFCSSPAPFCGGSRDPARRIQHPLIWLWRIGRVRRSGFFQGRSRRGFDPVREGVCHTWGTPPARSVQPPSACGVRVLSRVE